MNLPIPDVDPATDLADDIAASDIAASDIAASDIAASDIAASDIAASDIAGFNNATFNMATSDIATRDSQEPSGPAVESAAPDEEGVWWWGHPPFPAAQSSRGPATTSPS